MACLRMALIARDGHAPSLFALLDGCRLRRIRRRTQRPGHGLLYHPFADFTRDRFQLHAEVITASTPARLTRELDSASLVIASVHKEIRQARTRSPRNRRPPRPCHRPRQDEQVAFRNPSGHTPQEGVATLPEAPFKRFAAHRGIALHI